MQFLRITLAMSAIWFTSALADAALLFEIHQVGSDVVVTGTGSIDLTGMTFVSLYQNDAFMDAFDAELLVAGGDSDIFSYTPLPGETGYGSGGLTFTPLFSGDSFGFDGIEGGILVPRDYVSGDPLSGTSTYTGQTFASLGLTPGTYIYETPTDTITLEISESVPEPSSMALLGLTSLGFAISARRRKQRHQISAV